MKSLKEKIYLIDGLRTGIGSPYRSLKHFTAAQLAALVVKEIVHRNKIKGSDISEVILGNAVAAGVGQNMARQASCLAGIPESVPAYTVNNVCGSGLQSVVLGLQSIAANNADVVIAGGAESATHTPNLLTKDERALKDHKPIDSAVYDGLWCLLTGKHMGQLCEETAHKYKISREDQDRYALVSHVKSCTAQDNEKFIHEIIPVRISKTRTFQKDERPRRNIDREKIASLPPAFEKDGTITSGNACTPSDGACAVLLASEAFVKNHAIEPMAHVLGFSTVAVKPEMIFTAGINAIKECLRKCELSINDIDLFEIGESFAAQALLTRQKLKIPPHKMNLFGGDVAMGHPLGAAGTRILVTLLHALKTENKKKGIACICLGGGGAIAVAIERIE